MPGPLVVPSRFNGPLESGNGGYVAGAVAALLGGSAAVSLRRPVPLDRPLEVRLEGDSARVLDGDALIAEAARAHDFAPEVPEPASPADARRASGRYRGRPDGEFSHCFVCGLARDDSLRVFAGEVEGRDLVATPWTPPAWTAGADGNVRPEIVWAVLDCPTYFAAHLGRELTMSFLARMTGRLDAAVPAGEEQVIVSWPIDAEGRKRLAGSAVLSAEGDTLAVAEVLLIEARSA